MNDSVIKIFDDIESAYRKQQDIDNNPVINLITLLEEVSDRKIENAPKYIEKFDNEVAEIEARIKTGIEALTAPKVVEKKKRAQKVNSKSNDLTVPASKKSAKKKRFKFCPECGTKNASNRKKCKGCGRNISDVIPITEYEYELEHLLDDDLDDLISLEDLSSRDFEYELDGIEVRITGYKGSSDSVNIPSHINGLPVTSIGDRAFSVCISLKSINIPKGVTSIGSSAFSGCSSLESIVIPNSVTSIDFNTFAGCSLLKSIKIPNSVIKIVEGAFSYCNKLTNIKIPKGVTFIDDCAFYTCKSLKSITIPDSVAFIG